MSGHQPTKFASFSIADAAKSRVEDYLHKVYAEDYGLPGNLDRWTQRRITEENMAKLDLVFESDDPAEACYGDLIREIDTEAEYGIFMARQGTPDRHLARVIDEPGVSGKLYRHMNDIAPLVFADETAHSNMGLDLVWVTVEARHFRAHVDAKVSEIVMTHLLDDADAAADMANAIRALHYTFHESIVRDRCELPRILDDRRERDVVIMVSEMAKRSGCYAARAEDIRRKADPETQRIPLKLVDKPA